MSHRPKNNRKFQDFRSKIRGADSHEDAEQILWQLTPEAIESKCMELIEERGEKMEEWHTDTWKFQAEAFRIMYYPSSDELELGRWDGEVFDPVFVKRGSVIVHFEPIRTWNVLNFLEEIKQTGDLSI